MKKDEVHEIILGVALVALAYALLKHHKQNGNGTGMNNVLNVDRSPLSGNDPTRPAQGQAYDPISPAAFVTVADLLRGSVHDIVNNDQSATAIPMVGDVVSQAVTDYTNPGGVGPQDSVIRVPGAYW
jgi:hypothetical protein